jgi:hypothetical protein
MRLVSATVWLACTLWAQQPFVPADYVVPTEFRTAKYKLVPLGPAVVHQDYEAYMSSIEHLQKTFGGGRWPTKDITMTDAMKDMENEQSRFEKRQSFAYGVLSLDGKKEWGSVYVRPSRKAGYDAMVTMWVTKAKFDQGFEDELYKDVKGWVGKSWPFGKVAFVGRDISKEAFAKLADKK